MEDPAKLALHSAIAQILRWSHENGRNEEAPQMVGTLLSLYAGHSNVPLTRFYVRGKVIIPKNS